MRRPSPSVRVRRRALLGLLCALASACAPAVEEPDEPTPDVRVPAAASDRASKPSGTPWLALRVQAEDPREVMDWIHRIGGYLQVAVVGADPPIEDTSALVLFGQLNPNLKLRDVDGDGRADVVAEVPSLATSDQGQGADMVLLFGTDALEGTEADIGMVVVDFEGRVVQASWAGRRVLRATEDPAEIALEPLRAPADSRPCDNAIDEDGDGWTDRADPDCLPGGRQLELGYGVTACNDGQDNDGDGAIDAEDPDCRAATALSELPSCANGIDDDGDGWFDGEDPDCGAPDGAEQGFSTDGCNDGQDNDGDGYADRLDPQCGAPQGAE
jgi:hypothetical protein